LATIQPRPALIVFDGVCNLCNGLVQFVIARDPAGRFQFAAVQSASARRMLELHNAPEPLPDSIALVEEGRVFTRSTAALRIARRLPFPWPLTTVLLAVPRPVRDSMYDLVARSRYRWFGQRRQCMVPSPALRSRFLE
jgi:predicted DCC family thiol-disulfide oxidoreductase YuxK